MNTALTSAKNAVTSRFARQILRGQKNAPDILFVAGVAGVVVSTVMACRATLKIDELNHQYHQDLDNTNMMHIRRPDDYSERDKSQDQAKIHVRHAVGLTKLYGPSIAIGLVSIGALRKSHNILTTRNAGLMAAYAVLDKGFSEYRERVLDLVGPDKERELRYGSEEREFVTENKNGTPKVIKKNVFDHSREPSIYARLFTEFNQNWSPQPEYNVLFLRAQQNYANDLLNARGHLFLNEVYDMLGLERTQPGVLVGWVKGSKGGDNYVDFGIFDGQNPDGFFDFVVGREGAIMLDFNVDGVVWDLI